MAVSKSMMSVFQKMIFRMKIKGFFRWHMWIEVTLSVWILILPWWWISRFLASSEKHTFVTEKSGSFLLSVIQVLPNIKSHEWKNKISPFSAKSNYICHSSSKLAIKYVQRSRKSFVSVVFVSATRQLKPVLLFQASLCNNNKKYKNSNS